MKASGRNHSHSKWVSVPLALLKGLLKTVGVLLLTVIIAVVAILAFFFATPEITIKEKHINWAIAKFAPESVKLSFDRFDVRIQRPEGLPFAKRLKIETDNLCVRYEGEAVDSCFSDIFLAATAGWGGERLKGESLFMPRLVQIEPFKILAGKVHVDLTKFPPEDPNKKDEGGIDVLSLVRKQILPKWKVEGSRLELADFDLILGETEDGKPNAYRAKFDLLALEDGRAIHAILSDFAATASPLRADAIINVIRPENWFEDPGANATGERVWKVFADADVKLNPRQGLKVRADADIENFQTLDFRVASNFRGMPAIQEVRLEAALREALLDGKVSGKFGAYGSQVRALDFVNCNVDANLDQKVGGVRCGPQAVRLQVKEDPRLRNPNLFVLAPHFDLRVTRLAFGDTKEADFTFKLGMNQLDLAALDLDLRGQVLQEPEQDVRYQIDGDLGLKVGRFEDVVRMLSRTPYSVPAPLNVLTGDIGLSVRLSANEKQGSVEYQTATRLDSRYQAVHLKFDGATNWAAQSGKIVPATNAKLSIEKLHLSLPRFDLRAPPQFAVDSRFGRIQPDVVEEKLKAEGGSNFRLHIATTTPKAIRLATNMTKSAVPIDVNIVYDGRKKPALGRDQAPGETEPTRLPSSQLAENTTGTQSAATTAANEIPVTVSKEQEKAQEREGTSAVTGSVVIGHTPIELFRRNAAVQELRVDFLPDGQQRLFGQIGVHYLEYDVTALLLGTTSDPQVRLASDPPLEQNDILAVLLFGRPLSELEEGQKGSVSSMSSAMANAALGVSSLYLLASTPIESVGYDPQRSLVTARVGLGGGATLEVGGGADASAVGIRKRLSRNFSFRSDVETLGTTGERTVSALIEWVRRF